MWPHMYELAKVSPSNRDNEIRSFERRSLEGREHVDDEKENNPSLDDQNAGTVFDQCAWLDFHKMTDKSLPECIY